MAKLVLYQNMLGPQSSVFFVESVSDGCDVRVKGLIGPGGIDNLGIPFFNGARISVTASILASVQEDENFLEVEITYIFLKFKISRYIFELVTFLALLIHFQLPKEH